MTARGTGRSPRVRFAPSPTGSLHLGNARTALFNWLLARRRGGTFVLRIEDTDTARQREGSEAGILEDLRWLGLDWDEGPDVSGPYGPYRQSERARFYREAAERLLDAGKAFRCFCPERSSDEASAGLSRYPGTCRALDAAEARQRAASGEPHAVRLIAMADGADSDETVVFEDRLRGAIEFPARELGDTVLLRTDGRPTYNFAAVVDDGAMAIDVVVRGDDHLSNTPRQVLIYRALGLRLPEFIHVPMVRGSDGARLSKRHGAASVVEYRREGYPVAGLLNALVLLGWSAGSDRDLLEVDEMIREFDPERLGRSPAVFDVKKLEWICGQHVKRAGADLLAREARERLAPFVGEPEGPVEAVDAWLAGVAEMIRPKLFRFGQIPEVCAGLYFPGGAPGEAEAASELASPEGRRAVEALVEALLGEPAVDLEAWHRLRERVAQRTGLKGRNLFHPLRALLTGSLAGPELDRLVPLAEQAARLFPGRVASIAARARAGAAWLASR